MTFYHPFQKVCIAWSENVPLLLAASGSTINSINLNDGKLLHQWPSQPGDLEESLQDDDDDRPSKKRKLGSNGQISLSRQQSEASDASIEIVAERKKGERKKSKFIDTKLPYISHLLATLDGKHVIAVTAEDKAIKVFEVSTKRQLNLLSQRSLPKKLCAVQLTKDQQTILAADKFGDVYAIPLHQSKDWTPKEKTANVYKPSATNLTVHTKGNLEALQQQLDHKQQNARKEGPNFEHQVLLGHVSLLTDLVVGEGNVDGRPRPFILTSDRDEHIRVSRGIPQAHIIEKFCLGHHDFVTKLCIPTQMPDILIAGNGEPSLRVYNWQAGNLLQLIPISPIVQARMSRPASNGTAGSRTWEKLAVSGLWSISCPGIDGLILVALEGLPLLLTFVVTSNGLREASIVEFRGNVLDIAALGSAGEVLVSIDSAHKPFSTKSYQDTGESQQSPFEVLRLRVRDGQIECEVTIPLFDITSIIPALPHVSSAVVGENTKSKSNEKTFSVLGESLYGLENLRKKRDITAEEEAALEAEEDVENLKLDEAEDAM